MNDLLLSILDVPSAAVEVPHGPATVFPDPPVQCPEGRNVPLDKPFILGGEAFNPFFRPGFDFGIPVEIRFAITTLSTRSPQ